MEIAGAVVLLPCVVGAGLTLRMAVPFAGAATGAVAVAQLIRLASGQTAGTLVQLGLGAPEIMIDGGRCTAPAGFLGGERMVLDPD